MWYTEYADWFYCDKGDYSSFTWEPVDGGIKTKGNVKLLALTLLLIDINRDRHHGTLLRQSAVF